MIASGRVELDAQGKPIRFPGVLLDDSERRTIEAERDRANALLHTFIEAVPGVVYAKDREGRLILGNRGVAELLGVARNAFASVVGSPPTPTNSMSSMLSKPVSKGLPGCVAAIFAVGSSRRTLR